MGDDWHEFFKDFPEFDPANSDLTEAALEAKCAAAPGREWVREAEERAARRRKSEEPEEGAGPA
jgi:hypothetical protein